MDTTRIFVVTACALALFGCSRQEDTAPTDEQTNMTQATETDDEASSADADEPTNSSAEDIAVTEITPGLTMRVLQEGSGDVAAAGQTASVHYTGWLHDTSAPENRGAKFDSSVDRGTPFEFPLGAGRVIQGWDQGVVGMQVGERRELTIAPELAYGDRAIGELIPPGSTLLFEVELLGLQGEAAAE